MQLASLRRQLVNSRDLQRSLSRLRLLQSQLLQGPKARSKIRAM